MADAKKTNNAPGQQKVHDVTNPDGSVAPTTQADWKNRDKSAGQTRPEDAGTVEPVEPETPAE